MNVVDAARVDPSVWQLQPRYELLLVEAEGLSPGPSDATSDAFLRAAERRAAGRIAGVALADVPELSAWRGAYRSFGAKPQRTRSSVEALLRRLDDGLPRIDRLTDVYNAVSIDHLLPVGGEDLAAYVGPPLLTRAGGDEPFDTAADGATVTEHPEPGEVIWRDDLGVTCRRWNWRQCVRTRLTTSTTRALFVLDWLPADVATQSPLARVGAELVAALGSVSPGLDVTTRHLANDPAGDRAGESG